MAKLSDFIRWTHTSVDVDDDFLFSRRIRRSNQKIKHSQAQSKRRMGRRERWPGPQRTQQPILCCLCLPTSLLLAGRFMVKMLQIRLKREPSSEVSGGRKPPSAGAATVACPDHFILADLPVDKARRSPPQLSRP
ncbi:hypothetical protein SAY87_012257 [Trapa incisa]|uniref:Uncharacterized protein n=1 Tax=Trapa incisa TaxID=236973 RepID=A0AAN7JJL1_9MYRT|nr:hypothetical protein SAY87_012257 [Trapa incisa]